MDRERERERALAKIYKYKCINGRIKLQVALSPALHYPCIILFQQQKIFMGWRVRVYDLHIRN